MMGEINIIEEKPLTLAEVEESLKSIKKRDKDLSERGTKVSEYIKKFNKTDLKKVEEIKKKISDLGLSRLKEKQIAKIININPKDIDSLRTILSGDNLTLKTEDLTRLLECLK
jgi:DNA-directed RNA polymerase subunit F